MTKICLGCNQEYNNDVWIHPDLKICSICYHIHIHSEVKEWDHKSKKWIEKQNQPNIKLDKWIKRSL